ncbi:hypothetical protein AB7M16_002524 [Bradyrhizobium sp. USDA 372]
MIEDEPRGSPHDQDLRQRANGLGDERNDLASPERHIVLSARVLRVTVDHARGAIEHSHGADHVDVARGSLKATVASGERGAGPEQNVFRDQLSGDRECEQEGDAAGAHHAKQGMDQNEDKEEQGRPERVEQHRT